MNGATPESSRAQKPKPCSAKCARKRAASASLAALSASGNRYRITSGSADIAANASRSSSRHSRSNRRDVRSTNDVTGPSARELPLQQLVHQRGIGLPLSRFHHLTHEEAEELVLAG